jgi:hypothetical protein
MLHFFSSLIAPLCPSRMSFSTLWRVNFHHFISFSFLFLYILTFSSNGNELMKGRKMFFFCFITQRTEERNESLFDDWMDQKRSIWNDELFNYTINLIVLLFLHLLLLYVIWTGRNIKKKLCDPLKKPATSFCEFFKKKFRFCVSS